jgi:DNA-binding MarR family transcriptional regulator
MTEISAPVRDFRANLRVLEREVELSMTSEAGCCGVTFAQCHLLLEVQRLGKTSVTGLASVFELDKSTLSRTVDAACRAGLIDRTVDPLNRRQQVISLTALGGEKADAINGLCDASYSRLFDFIPAGQRVLVVQSVAILAEAMRQKRRHPEAPCCVDADADARGMDLRAPSRHKE